MTPLTPPLRWGILATGRIAETFARAVAAIPKAGRVEAVGSRSSESALRFAKSHGIPKAHSSYEALLADPDIQVVYIATPHAEHLHWGLKALAAGKHVLCEKPACMNLTQARELVAAAEARGLFFMEAFMYRCHPQTRRVLELLRSGLIGRIDLVQGAFSFNRPGDPAHRLWNKNLGGGGILDVGCYPVSWARLVAGVVEGKPFANPVQVTGTAQFHPELGVDVCAAATLSFASGMIAQVSCGIGLEQENVLRIYGQTGWLELSAPFVCEYSGGPVNITLNRRGAKPEDLSIKIERDLYTYEVEAVADTLSKGLTECPFMPHADTLGNMTTLDQWRAAVGLRYPGE